jgi:hypothetical protein
MKKAISKKDKKDRFKGSVPKQKKKVFMSFVHEDADIAEELKDMIEKTQSFQVIPFDQSQEWHRDGMWNMPLLHSLISEADSFVVVYTKNTVKPEYAHWLKYEFGFAVFRASISESVGYSSDKNLISKKCTLVRAVMDDQVENIAESPPELRAFKAVDYRDMHSHEYSLDKLVTAIHGDDSQPSIDQRRRYVFNEAMAPNPRREMLRRVLQSEFEKCFKSHINPLQEKIQHLAELQHAQDNLMTPEIISIEEANAYDDIWVVSHTLHNDLHDEKIRGSIIKNLQEGIRYTYFVPNTQLIAERKIIFEETYSEYCNQKLEKSSRKRKKMSGNFSFILLEAGVFMPFDELVVYDGESSTNRWGYIQMNYDRPHGSNKDAGLVMKIPDRTLSTIIEFLRGMKVKAQVTA